MNWIPLTSITTLDVIHQNSYTKPQLIFKHSTRCSISSTVKYRLDAVVTNELIDCYYLDLIAHRDISNAIATNYNVVHESPQIILIKNGACLYHQAQQAIYWDDVEEHIV